MVDNNIMDKLIEILENKFQLINISWNEMKSTPLTSNNIKIDGINFYYFLMLIEDEFSIMCSPNEINESNFKTLSDIEKFISEKTKCSDVFN